MWQRPVSFEFKVKKYKKQVGSCSKWPFAKRRESARWVPALSTTCWPLGSLVVRAAAAILFQTDQNNKRQANASAMYQLSESVSFTLDQVGRLKRENDEGPFDQSGCSNEELQRLVHLPRCSAHLWLRQNQAPPIIPEVLVLLMCSRLRSKNKVKNDFQTMKSFVRGDGKMFAQFFSLPPFNHS